ncbi:MAG: hypothetical protein H7319_06705 [Spirosoma sp.]|nr:hypothetical protein [Spirosoma sp.]
MPVCFFLLTIALLSCQPAPPFRYAGPKIEGINLVAPPELISAFGMTSRPA